MRTRILQIFACVCAKRAAAPVQYYFAPVTFSWSSLHRAPPSQRCVAVLPVPAARAATARDPSSHDRFDDRLSVFDDDVEVDLLISVLLAELALGVSKARGERVF